VQIAPQRLYAIMARHADPLEMVAGEPIVAEIDSQRREDLGRGLGLAPAASSLQARVTVLPDAPFSHRVCGTLANELAAMHPRQAQAVVEPLRDGTLRISVRAPRAAPHGAAAFCANFGGSGRAAAAGIDALDAASLGRFIAAFMAAHWG
jgi:hypothetical protein